MKFIHSSKWTLEILLKSDKSLIFGDFLKMGSDLLHYERSIVAKLLVFMLILLR